MSYIETRGLIKDRGLSKCITFNENAFRPIPIRWFTVSPLSLQKGVAEFHFVKIMKLCYLTFCKSNRLLLLFLDLLYLICTRLKFTFVKR